MRLLTLLVLALLASSARSQQLDPARLAPVQVPVRDAGVFDWNTQRWIEGPRADEAPLQTYTVFRNTCSWTGGAFGYGPEHCEAVIDTGRIPAPDTPPGSLEGNPVGLMGVTSDQLVSSFQFSYCTYWAMGTVDIKVGFYENLRGGCAGGMPVQPPPLSTQAVPRQNGTAYFDFGAATGNPLPGSSNAGDQSCWTVTIQFDGFCMRSEGDGKYDNDQASDAFSWSFEHANPNSVYGETRVIIAGEPSTGGYGAGSYNLPLGTGGLLSNPCGTGFGTSTDGYWLNVDGSAPGVPNTSTVQGTCRAASAFGTNCYWFGGWPASPLSSFWMVLEAVGSCSGCNNSPVSYCTAGTSSAGCRALVTANGSASSSSPTGFYLSGYQADAGVQGQFLYGTSGRVAHPWGAGSSYLCVRPPLTRAGLLTSAGTVGLCDGVFKQDLNAFWQAAPGANPGAGSTVQAQLWYRDPGSTAARPAVLSSAVEFTVCP